MTIGGSATLRGPGRGTGESGSVSLEPASAYEAVTRQMVVAMAEELREIKARLNGLLFMVAGSVLLDVVPPPFLSYRAESLWIVPFPSEFRVNYLTPQRGANSNRSSRSIRRRFS